MQKDVFQGNHFLFKDVLIFFFNYYQGLSTPCNKHGECRGNEEYLAPCFCRSPVISISLIVRCRLTLLISEIWVHVKINKNTCIQYFTASIPHLLRADIKLILNLIRKIILEFKKCNRVTHINTYTYKNNLILLAPGLIFFFHLLSTTPISGHFG